MNKYLIIILGPTAVGKTRLAGKIAKYHKTEIISTDARQVYKEMSIGTAVPSDKVRQQIKHHFIQCKSIRDYFNASLFEQEALHIVKQIFQHKNTVVATGGSMLYIDALCKGLDELPVIDPELRENLIKKYKKEGLLSLQRMLKMLDPKYYDNVDVKNPKRLLHAIEICLMTGIPYSSLRKKKIKKRPFNIIKIGLVIERDKLYNRINQRVDKMISQGLVDEAKRLIPYKNLNALNTVGYKELFDYFSGKTTFYEAIALIKRNSRRYAKRQLSWFNKDDEIKWFSPDNFQDIIQYLERTIQHN